MKFSNSGPVNPMRLPVLICAALAAAACSSGGGGSTGGSISTSSGASSGVAASSTSGAATAVGTGASTGTGAGSNGTGGTSGTSSTSGALSATAVAKAGFTSPFDGLDDGQGDVFFTAIGANGSTVFQTNDDGSSATTPVDLQVTGLTAAMGIAISSDGNTLYVADPAAETDSFGTAGNITGVSLGELFSIDDNTGGAATPLSGTAGYIPVGVAVLPAVGSGGSDTLYFTGKDPTTGNWGVFSTTGSGTPTTVAEGVPFINPSGLLVTANSSGAVGTIYVADRGQILALNGNTVAVLKAGLPIGFPGGLAISADGSTLLISSLDPATGTEAITQLAVAGGTPTYILNGSGGFGSNVEPAGLQGNGAANTPYVFVDGLAGGTGTVYTVQ